MVVPGLVRAVTRRETWLASRRQGSADSRMATSASILILERDAGSGRAHRDVCEAHGAQTGTCADGEQAIGSLTGGRWDALLLAPHHVQAAATRLLRVARDHDVELVLGVPSSAGVAELELAI